MSEPKADDRVVIDGPVPFRESAVWTHQRQFYAGRSEAVWSEGIVPHYITSNPFMAETYADLIAAYAIDMADDISDERPLTILELGAGSGRLSHHLLRALLRQREQLGPAGSFPFRYVMSDIAEGNIAFWRSHLKLAPYLASGLLDFARFDLERTTDLELEWAARAQGPADPTGPLVVIANYVFDSVPVDVFLTEGDQLAEVAATWLVPPDLAGSDDSAALFGRGTIRWTARAASVPYYGNLRLDALVEQYHQEAADGPFTVPVPALGCIDRLQAMSGGDLLLLSSDKGFFNSDEAGARAMPTLAAHGGAMSTLVNYDAIARYVGLLGGRSFGPVTHNEQLCTTAFVLSAGDRVGAGGPDGVARAFAATVNRYSPADFFRLYQWMHTQAPDISLESALSALALSRYDPGVFAFCARRLFEALPELGPSGAAALRNAMAEVADTYFPIGEGLDVDEAVGSLLASLHDFAKALECFEASMHWHGPQPQVVAKRDACLVRLAETADYLNR
ncbi:MAG: hypothetical protein JWM47_1396 [Acidimicrobiales bacterium]|nr:hypothetical protein [Acidimicrobiales bacterium]